MGQLSLPLAQESAGLIFCIFAALEPKVQSAGSHRVAPAKRVVGEVVDAVRRLHEVMEPKYPLAAFTNPKGNALLTAFKGAGLFQHVLPLRVPPEVHAVVARVISSASNQSVAREVEAIVDGSGRMPITGFFHKMVALMSSPFERTLFMDNDVWVIQGSLVHRLLHKTLDVVDVAAPLDPLRRKVEFAGRGAPTLCSCLFAYRNSDRVRQFFLKGLERLVARRHPSGRQGDQEMLYYQWTSGEEEELRVLSLPEEFYCPMKTVSKQTGMAGWRNAFGGFKYDCLSVHGHNSMESAREYMRARPKQLPAAASRSLPAAALMSGEQRVQLPLPLAAGESPARAANRPMQAHRQTAAAPSHREPAGVVFHLLDATLPPSEMGHPPPSGNGHPQRHNAVNAIDDAIDAARFLRDRMHPKYPLAMLSRSEAHAELKLRGALSLWELHRPLKLPMQMLQRAQRALASSTDAREKEQLAGLVNGTVNGPLAAAWYKFAALLASPFERSLFLDSLVWVVQANFVDRLLQKSLALADIAAPIEADRARRPIVSLAGVPLLNTGVFAYRSSPATDGLLTAAAHRVLQVGPRHVLQQMDRGAEAKGHCDYTERTVQEMIWLEWTSGTHDQLRILALPEETYCPMFKFRWNGANYTNLRINGKKAEWSTDFWGYRYECGSVAGRWAVIRARRELENPSRPNGTQHHVNPAGRARN